MIAKLPPFKLISHSNCECTTRGTRLKREVRGPDTRATTKLSCQQTLAITPDPVAVVVADPAVGQSRAEKEAMAGNFFTIIISKMPAEPTGWQTTY